MLERSVTDRILGSKKLLMKTKLLLICLILLAVQGVTHGQDRAESPGVAGLESELRQFYASYAEDLRKHRAESIADRYDPRGFFSMGNGAKRFVSFDDNKKRYTTQWTGPKSFEWKELSFDVLSPNSAAVTGLFDWTSASGVRTFSYTAVLTKMSGQWRIRIEDESFNTASSSAKVVSGSPTTPGPFKFTLTGQSNFCVSPHRHTTEQRVTVKSGRVFIMMGELETAKLQRFDAGSTFVIPANTWHVEWSEGDFVADVEQTSPSRTERPPDVPRIP